MVGLCKTWPLFVVEREDSNAQGQQSFIPGAQLGDAKPTGMQRLAAGANIAGRGLAAALTGLQTAYGLQGGNVSALGRSWRHLCTECAGFDGEQTY